MSEQFEHYENDTLMIMFTNQNWWSMKLCNMKFHCVLQIQFYNSKHLYILDMKFDPFKSLPTTLICLPTFYKKTNWILDRYEKNLLSTQHETLYDIRKKSNGVTKTWYVSMI